MASGHGDADKLRAARELQQMFSNKGPGPKKKGPRGGQFKAKKQESRPYEDNFRKPNRDLTRTPPIMTRNYHSAGSFVAPTKKTELSSQPSLLGGKGMDFLRRDDRKSVKPNTTVPQNVPQKKPANANTISQADGGSEMDPLRASVGTSILTSIFEFAPPGIFENGKKAFASKTSKAATKNGSGNTQRPQKSTKIVEKSTPYASQPPRGPLEEEDLMPLSPPRSPSPVKNEKVAIKVSAEDRPAVGGKGVVCPQAPGVSPASPRPAEDIRKELKEKVQLAAGKKPVGKGKSGNLSPQAPCFKSDAAFLRKMTGRENVQAGIADVKDSGVVKKTSSATWKTVGLASSKWA